MKIRTGFVSNSSSSSFIVGFKKGQVPKTAAELQQLLFHDLPALDVYNGPFSTQKIAETVFEDMAKGPATPEQILEACEGYWDDEPEESEAEFRRGLGLKGDELWAYWEKQDQEHQTFLAKKHAWVMEQVKAKGLELYTFEYADEDGAYFSTLEHGEIFELAPFHVRISRH